MTLLFVLAFSINAYAVCEVNLDESRMAVDDIGAELNSHFPFSVIIAGKDIMEDLMGVAPLSIADWSYELWGTSYTPLYFLDFPSFNYFMVFVRWAFLMLIIVRVGFQIINNLL